jgi:hypothetical protein
MAKVRRRPGGALWTAVAALLAVAVGPAALAAEAAAARPGRYHLGPLWLTPKLELRNAGVDTNVFNQQAGAIPDTQVVLRPSVAAALPVRRRLRLTGSGFLDVNYFRRRASERSTDFGGEGRAELDFGPFTFLGAGGGGQFKQRFSIDLDQRLLRQERWGSAGLRFKPTRRLTLAGTVSARLYRYEGVFVNGADVREALERNSLAAGLELRHALTGLTTLVVTAEGIEDRFLRAGLDPGPPAVFDPLGGPRRSREAPSRRAQSYRLLGGFEFSDRAFLNGKVLLGYREFPSSRLGSAPPYRGPVAAVATSFPLFRFGRVSVTADRDVSYAVTASTARAEALRNTFVSTRVGALVALDLPFDLIGRAGGGFEEARYVLPYTLGPVLARRADHLYTASASLMRSLGEGVRLGGAVTWQRRVSNFPGLSYRGLRYGVQAELVP